jgi:hypothetical protein
MVKLSIPVVKSKSTAMPKKKARGAPQGDATRSVAEKAKLLNKHDFA